MSAAGLELRPGAHVPATLLASAAVVASALPLGRLFLASPWWPSALLAIGVVAGLGMALRARRVGPTAIALAQLVGLVLLFAVAFAPADPLLGGVVPTPATLGHWRDLAASASRTIMENAAPAPAPDGVAFVMAAAIGLVAWAVDVVAVGSRMPAVAGLPLLTPLLTAIANSSGSLGAREVVPPLVLWGAMLLEQERDWLATWRPDLAGAHRLPARGRRLGLGAALLAAAVAVGLASAAALPHLPQRYLADGLGRGDLGSGRRVGFSPDSDLLADLRNTDRTPVLVYSTDDVDAPPLRVSVASSYVAGHWTPRPTTVTPSQAPQLPHPQGLTDRVPRSEVHLNVTQTALGRPYLASPVPIVWGTVVGARWNVQDDSGVPVVDATPRSYELTYLSLNPSPEFLSSLPPAGRGMRESLALPSDVDTPTFRAALAQATGDAATPYERAVRMQSWLRDTGGFTYSLELAPLPAGMDEAAAKRTALDRFLQTKRGYCVPFATAMVMMARAEGIPARLATGFLPGTVTGSSRTVLASDAHAWPELYFDGVGWLRFEPTPSERSGPVPRYAAGTSTAGPTTSTTTANTPTSSAAPTPIATTERPDTDTGEVAGAAQGSGWWPAIRVLGAAAVLLSIVPAVAAWVRARRRARALDEAALAEAEWLILAERLQDLGLEVPAAATPRQLHARVTDTAVLDRDASAALRRVLWAVEDARYAPPGTTSPAAEPGADVRADAIAVYRGAASLRSASMRARAMLLPRAGLRALRLPVPRRRTPTPRH